MSRAELDTLLNALVPFAQEMLAKHGEFIPFAGMLARDGELTLVGGHTEEGRSHPNEVMDLLVTGLRRAATEGKCRAAALCVKVTVHANNGQNGKDNTDAIQVHLEHANGQAVEVFVPYARTILNRIKYSDHVTRKGTPRVFLVPH